MRLFAAIALLAGSTAAFAQPVPFAATEIDANNAGDCKALADIDGDGRADPIIGGSSLSWYQAGADFSRHIIRSQAVFDEFTTDAQALDVDADGDIDIIVPDGGGIGHILWFENPSLDPLPGVGNDPKEGDNWIMHEVGIHGQTVHDLEAADLDNDGRLDIVTSGHGIAHVWKQTSTGSWIDINLSDPLGSGVYLGDIDGDGFRDIATPQGWVRNPHDLVNGAWTTFPISGTSGQECLLADLNGDGRLDLLTCDAHGRATVYWFEQPASPTSPNWTRRVLDPSMGSHHPEAADFNADGKMDLLLGLELQELSLYINQGGSPPTFAKQQLDDHCAHNARVGDVSGDGLPDVLGCDYLGHPPVEVFINQGQPPCYANCDASTAAPILTINDFQCFINRYAAGNPAANCDRSTGAPVLNINDFQCFVNTFASGCP